jgi:drug/metabolite transporter (DMT)-like permease
MEWMFLIVWLSIINGDLGGQYILNWMGNQQRFVGDKPVGVTPGVMTWWRELSKLAWAFVAVVVEKLRGKKWKYFWPGMLSLTTIIIAAFTGVIENIGFFYLPKYYSPHLYAPYVNVYLAFLPFLGKVLFKATIRKEHWYGVILVVLGLGLPHVAPHIMLYGAQLFAGMGMAWAQHFVATQDIKPDPKAILDFTAILWIIIINICLCSQQILNNKTVQTVLPGVGANALVFWREIWKMLFICSALFIFPLIGSAMKVNLPQKVDAYTFESKIITKLSDIEKRDSTAVGKIAALTKYYEKSGDSYVMKPNLSKEAQSQIEAAFKAAEFHRFFALFDGTIIPKNWWPILFVVLAGLTGYIYSFGFFKLSKFAAHFWVPYTNAYLALIPFVMFLFGEKVTGYQIAGAVVVTLGLMIGVSDYSRNKVEEIEKRHKEI